MTQNLDDHESSMYHTFVSRRDLLFPEQLVRGFYSSLRIADEQRIAFASTILCSIVVNIREPLIECLTPRCLPVRVNLLKINMSFSA